MVHPIKVFLVVYVLLTTHICLFIQVSLRWIYEKGVASIVKSYNKARLSHNLEIFDWELTEADRLKISQIPQKKLIQAEIMFSSDGESTSVDPAEMDIVEE
jgi:3''-deamino-3''-oxonicotianamine reductase